MLLECEFDYMKKRLFYLPAVISLLFYIFMGINFGFKSINYFVWVFVFVLFISAYFMNRNNYFASIGGIIVGIYLIYMSTIDTGQIIKMEMPLGIIFIIYYLVCGILIYKNK